MLFIKGNATNFNDKPMECKIQLIALIAKQFKFIIYEYVATHSFLKLIVILKQIMRLKKQLKTNIHFIEAYLHFISITKNSCCSFELNLQQQYF